MNAVVPAKVGSFRHSLLVLGTVVMAFRLLHHANYVLWEPFGVAFAGGGDAVHLQLTGLRLLVYALPLLGIYMNSRDRVVAVHVDGGAGDRGFTCVPGTNLRGG